ncbi:hypothetical protein BLAT2472_20017 [Burkholderia latens]
MRHRVGQRARYAQWLEGWLAFASAGADHAAILCANAGSLRERGGAAADPEIASTVRFESTGVHVGGAANETPRADERERGVSPTQRAYRGGARALPYWPK